MLVGEGIGDFEGANTCYCRIEHAFSNTRTGINSTNRKTAIQYESFSVNANICKVSQAHFGQRVHGDCSFSSIGATILVGVLIKNVISTGTCSRIKSRGFNTVYIIDATLGHTAKEFKFRNIDANIIESSQGNSGQREFFDGNNNLGFATVGIGNHEGILTGSPQEFTQPFVRRSTAFGSNHHEGFASFANSVIIFGMSDKQRGFANGYFLNSFAAISTGNHDQVCTWFKVGEFSSGEELIGVATGDFNRTILQADFHNRTTVEVNGNSNGTIVSAEAGHVSEFISEAG